MSNIDYIINLCFEISEQGKTPSVALVRNAAAQPLAIPEVIKGIQFWKANPNTRPAATVKQKPKISGTEKSLQERVAQLEAQISTITQTLTQITAEKKP